MEIKAAKKADKKRRQVISSRKCGQRQKDALWAARNRAERAEQELVEEKEYLNAQIQETSMLLQESEAHRLAESEHLNAKLQEQTKLLEEADSFHLADSLTWEEEKRTMTEEKRTMTEEMEELRRRVQELEQLQWGAICPVLLGNWAENYINII